MPVGDSQVGELYPVDGIRLSAIAAGIKKPDHLDVVLFEICEGASIAGAYTQNAFCAAPVTVSKQHSEAAQPRYFLVNTGNANAGTGVAGVKDALDCCEAVSVHAKTRIQQVLPFSTGVIGEPLPVGKIKAAIPEAFANLKDNLWLDAARGIMTTDTRPKAFSLCLPLADKKVTITGVAKGAGMIKPNMATMLAYIFTDAEIENDFLKELLDQAINKSFNRITVDGDTSTNDCCMLVATGKSSVKVSNTEPEIYQAFKNALDEVFIKLAQGLIKDAEGVSKFVNVKVEEGRSSAESLQVAYTIAESPLVKTALFASDPNWGRILAAVGRAGVEELDITGVEIFLNEVCIVRDGSLSDSYTEAKGEAVMNQQEITITVKLGRGSESEQVWTSDLSYDYVRINAEYRT
jgi:glutamate N-acetyltransferase / amino-acid N-acetyltransferase